jgi:hypothetical protein
MNKLAECALKSAGASFSLHYTHEPSSAICVARESKKALGGAPPDATDVLFTHQLPKQKSKQLKIGSRANALANNSNWRHISIGNSSFLIDFEMRNVEHFKTLKGNIRLTLSSSVFHYQKFFELKHKVEFVALTLF